MKPEKKETIEAFVIRKLTQANAYLVESEKHLFSAWQAADEEIQVGWDVLTERDCKSLRNFSYDINSMIAKTRRLQLKLMIATREAEAASTLASMETATQQEMTDEA